MSEYGEMNDRTSVRMERVLPGAIDDVWEYLTDSDKRSTWLAAGIMDLQVGGKADLTFDFRRLTSETTPERFLLYESGHRQSGRITQCNPPHLLSFTWNEKNGHASEVRFELKSQGTKTLLILTHSRLPNRQEMINVSGGWHTHLGILEDRLNKHTPRLFWATFLKMESEYQKRIPDFS